MVVRNDKGKLSFKSLDFEIVIGDMFEICKTEKEVLWVTEQLSSIIECSSDERLDEIESY